MGALQVHTALLRRLAGCFQLPLEQVQIEQALRGTSNDAESASVGVVGVEAAEFGLMRAAKALGIRLAPAELSLPDACRLVEDGYPIVISEDSSGTSWRLLERGRGRELSAHLIDESAVKGIAAQESGHPRDLSATWLKNRRCLVAQPMLHCRSLSEPGGTNGGGVVTTHHQGGHHAHLKPTARLSALLRMELRDVATIALFALVAGFTGLAVPLAVESLVNTVAWGTYLQPLLVLSLLLLGFMAFGGFLRILQIVVVEILQQRIYVRIVGDLAQRFAAADRSALDGENPAEVTNRYFDIMTIQKATAGLLLDGIAIILSTTIGLTLLAFYHPFLLGFDLVLLLAMTLITYLMGRGGAKSAIDESMVKYRVGHWLQDVLSYPTAFRLHGGGDYAVDRANRLTVEYLGARRRHFRVLLRQFSFAIFLQAAASTALLGVGGWLVVRGELTLGQLVASELVVTAIVGAFAKIGKSLESFYDLLAAIDKVGHLLDIPMDAPVRPANVKVQDVAVRWKDVLPSATFDGQVAGEVKLSVGTFTAITGPSASGKTWLLEILGGLRSADSGFAEIAGLDARDAANVSDGSLIALAGDVEIFNGSIVENIRLGRGRLGVDEVRSALERVRLLDVVLQLPAGADSVLQSGGHPFSSGQRAKLMLARALVAQPRILLMDGLLDRLAPEDRNEIWRQLEALKPQMTCLVCTHCDEIIARCDHVVRTTAALAPAGTSTAHHH
ncbi:MAG: ABC transporter ATP-binding protein [Pirellulales bacterium]